MINFSEAFLTFTDDEVILLLRQLGYTIDEVQTFTVHPVYHNDVEYRDVTVLVAYKGDRPLFKQKNKSAVEELCGLHNVFKRELKKKIKELFNPFK